MQLLSFVIPCYRSEHTVSAVVNEIITTVAQNSNFDYEIILVSDASPDRVFDVIKTLSQNNPKIKGMAFSKNFGQHAAILAGFRIAKGDIIFTIDDDGQIPVDELFKLVEKINEGFDVVFAKYEHKQHNAFRNLGSRCNLFMMEKLIGKPKGLSANSFMALKSFVVKEIIRYNSAYPYLAGLIFRTTLNVGDVIVTHREREQGKSGYTMAKLMKLWLNGFTAFSVKPLRWGIYVGALSALFGFVFGIITIVRKLLLPQMQAGYASMMSSIFFMGGMILLLLGLVGEYVGRIYICLNQRPQYVVKESVNIDD